MSFPGVTYLNALGHIARLNPPTVSILLLIVYFCLMQQMLLEGAVVASAFAADRTQETVARLKAWFARHGRQLATVVLSAIGAVLAVRGVLAFSLASRRRGGLTPVPATNGAEVCLAAGRHGSPAR